MKEILEKIATLKSRETVNLSCINLQTLTLEEVRTLPEDLAILNLNLFQTFLSPEVAIALIARLKPRSVNLGRVDLSALTKEQVETLPEDLAITDLDLTYTKLSPKVVIDLITKLKPRGRLNLAGIDLSTLTKDQVNTLPDGLAILDLILWDRRTISSEVAFALIARLKPSGVVDLDGTNLSDLTVEDVSRLPDDISITSIYIPRTKLCEEVKNALILKLKAQECVCE